MSCITLSYKIYDGSYNIMMECADMEGDKGPQTPRDRQVRR